MTTTQITIVVLALLFVGALALMWAGWRRREVRTGAVVPRLPAVPVDLGAPLGPPVPATYVSTTTAGDWLDRVVAHDLGVRSAAVVTVHEAGVLIARTGARDVFVPVGSLAGVERTPGMAGKYVGGAGLVVLRWRVDPAGEPAHDEDPHPAPDQPSDPSSGAPGRTGTLLDTGLRTRRAADRAALVDGVRALLPSTPATSPTRTSPTPTSPTTPPEEHP